MYATPLRALHSRARQLACRQMLIGKRSYFPGYAVWSTYNVVLDAVNTIPVGLNLSRRVDGSVARYAQLDSETLPMDNLMDSF